MQLLYFIVIIGALCCAFSQASLFYPASSAYGIFAAVAVPLELPPRNVFVSYNFEANYNLPAIWGTPPVYKGAESSEDWETGRKAACQANCTISEAEDSGEKEKEQEQELEIETSTAASSESTEPTEPTSHRSTRALLTRKNIYHIVKDKFKRSGFQGESCLLRLICETSATELGEINGVLGSLMHVIFSPSTSEPERLPLRYYQAEHDGWHGDCQHYERTCGESFLDLISQPFDEILKLIERNAM